MQRDEWKFTYSGKQIVEAASNKVAHHKRKKLEMVALDLYVLHTKV